MIAFWQRKMLALLILAAGSSLPADPQTVKFSDLFADEAAAPGEAAPYLTVDQLSMERLPELWQSLETGLADAKWDKVLTSTEVVLAWLPPASPEYAEALWFRGRAYVGKQDKEAFRRVATVYLRDFKDQPRTGWVLAEVATFWAGDKSYAEAAEAWKAAVEEGFALSAAQSLNAAACNLAIRDAAAVRSLLPPEEGLTATQRDRRTAMLLDSMLLKDDPALADPVLLVEDAPDIALRKAMILELRGKRAEARKAYATIPAARLTAEERAILQGRLKPRLPVWPPATTGTTSP